MKNYGLILILLLHFSSESKSQTRPQTENIEVQSCLNYLRGVGVPKDSLRGIVLLKSYVNNGNSVAMLTLGNIYKHQKNYLQASLLFEKAAKNGNTNGWFQLAVLNKDLKGKDQDLDRAYYYFKKGAELNNIMCIYGKAYMLFKGFGCIQNYSEAVKLFEYCANQGHTNSMYFYGLCLRNGYGITRDESKAMLWLKKARANGYIDAFREIGSSAPENSNIEAKKLAQLITENAQLSLPLDHYQKVEHNLSNKNIDGKFKGYLFRYDWSGENVINSSRITLDLKLSNNKLTGNWIENDSVSIPIKAEVTPYEVDFIDTKIKKKDHYSIVKPVDFIFNKAHLLCSIKNDSLYIVGNIELFSSTRNEPEKPLYISVKRSLTQYEKSSKVSQAFQPTLNPLNNEKERVSDMETSIKAFPNPCNDILKIRFHIKDKNLVKTELQNMSGQILISKEAGTLTSGFYEILIDTHRIPSGTYNVLFHYGLNTIKTQVIKL